MMVKPSTSIAPATEPARAVPQEARTRVLLMTNSVAIGGMEEHVELLARYLDRARFDVYAICPAWEPTDEFRRNLADAADHLAVITPDRRRGLVEQLAETWRFLRQMREWQIEVLHMHSTTYRGQIWALLAARLAGVKRIYVTEHLAPEHNLPTIERWVRDRFSSLVTGIVCVSKKNFEARRAHVQTPLDRTLVVNNGVDLGDFPPIAPEVLAELRARHQIPAGAPIVGTAVRFEPEKGLGYMVDAMPAIVEACPDTHFLMVGDGSLRAELEAHVARLGLSDCVRFVGFQSDPRPYLGLMDAFVLPVPVGSMSIGLLEAMAMERAVVMTFGGEGEAVIHGESGFCAEPRSPASIAEHVIKLLQDPELKETMGARARQRVAAEFSAQNVARVLSELYTRP